MNDEEINKCNTMFIGSVAKVWFQTDSNLV